MTGIEMLNEKLRAAGFLPTSIADVEAWNRVHNVWPTPDEGRAFAQLIASAASATEEAMGLLFSGQRAQVRTHAVGGIARPIQATPAWFELRRAVATRCGTIAEAMVDRLLEDACVLDAARRVRPDPAQSLLAHQQRDRKYGSAPVPQPWRL